MTDEKDETTGVEKTEQDSESSVRATTICLFEQVAALTRDVNALREELASVRGELVERARFDKLKRLRAKFVFDEKKERARCRVGKLDDEQFEKRLKKLAKTCPPAAKGKPRVKREKSGDPSARKALAQAKRELSEKLFWGLVAVKFPNAPIALAFKARQLDDYARTLYEDLVDSESLEVFLAKVEARLDSKK